VSFEGRQHSWIASVSSMTVHASDLPADAALVVVDVQKAFDDAEYWGPRDNPACESNIAELIAFWELTGRPMVFVQHDSTTTGSPLHPSSPGHDFKDFMVSSPDLLVRKSVNSSFHGTPDLERWLKGRGISTIVVCGITTNHCCETTARVGGNLGFDVVFVLDATHTFDRPDLDGVTVPAAELARMTATNVHGEFASVVRTRDFLPL
jgi:nicotinamidase-related amidase